jgi:hypothetical protein
VPVTRGSRLIASMNRIVSKIAEIDSAILPSRTTLSTTMSDPGLASFTAHRKYSVVDCLSASMKTTSKGPTSDGSASSAFPTLMSTQSATPARVRFARATSACFFSYSSVTIRPPGSSARASQIVL